MDMQVYLVAKIEPRKQNVELEVTNILKLFLTSFCTTERNVIPNPLTNVA